MATGLELLRTSSLDAVTAPVVAAAAGVSKGLVFHYFPSQRELQAAIAGAAADELIVILSDIDRAADHRVQLRAGLDGFIAYIERFPQSYAAIARDAGSDGLMREVLERARDAVVAIVCTVLGLDEPTPVARLYLRGWIALVEETAVQWVTRPAIDRAELVDYLEGAVYDLVVRAVGRGLDA